MVVGAAIGALSSCSAPCPASAIDCGVTSFVRAPCEIVSFSTTCPDPVNCHHGGCAIAFTRDQSCSITATFDDGTTSVSHVSVTSPACGCRTVTSADFIIPKGSKCSPPKIDQDAAVGDAAAAPDSTADALDAVGQ